MSHLKSKYKPQIQNLDIIASETINNNYISKELNELFKNQTGRKKSISYLYALMQDSLDMQDFIIIPKIKNNKILQSSKFKTFIINDHIQQKHIKHKKEEKGCG